MDRLLHQPEALLPRCLALACLARARRAHARLQQREDDAALHDLRVELRRLRVCLRAYRPLLEPDVRRGDARRLRALTRSTGALRDREAQVEWLRREDLDWSEAEQPARAWLLDHLSASERDEPLDEPADRFLELRKRLVRRLRRLELRLPRSGRPPERTGRDALAAAMEQAAGQLGDRLQEVRSASDRRELHRVRIAAKRLRYVMEPFRARIPDGPTLLKRLRGLHHLLGDLRDGDLLLETIAAARDEPPEDEAARAGLAALAERLHARRELIWGELERDWLHEAAGCFTQRVASAAAGLHRRDGVEIERKYLLSAMPELPDGSTAMEIDQGWLPGERLQERVRRTRDGSGERWHRTVKLGSGVERLELEEEADPELGARLWPLTEGRRVRKRRHRVPDGERVWEVDRFTDRDLVLAEVELPSADAPVELPAWLAPLVVAEVTGEAEYVNRNLAR